MMRIAWAGRVLLIRMALAGCTKCPVDAHDAHDAHRFGWWGAERVGMLMMRIAWAGVMLMMRIAWAGGLRKGRG